MKALCDCQDLFPTSCCASHAQGVFVGFGAGIYKENTIQARWSNTHQVFRRARANFECDGVALKQQLVNLVLNCPYQARVAIAEGGDRVPTVEIEYASAICSEQVATVGTLGNERQLPVDRNRDISLPHAWIVYVVQFVRYSH